MAFEQAKQYLARVLPWSEDGSAFANIHWTFVPQDKKINGHVPWGGRAVRDMKEAENVLSYITNLSNTKDIYVCLSSQKEAEQVTGKNNFVYYKAKRNQQNAVALKSLFLDIDAKGHDKNSYQDIQAAATALNKFIAETGLPKPSIVVSSGGGLHVYWTLMRALTPHEWQPLADALAEATRQHKLRCDTNCTVDSARILRIPDTFNCKTDPRRPVKLVGADNGDYSVERIEQALEKYKVARTYSKDASETNTLDPALFPAKAPLQGVSDLALGVESGQPQVNLDEVAKECAFIKQAFTTGGKDYGNPLWHLSTLLATFALDGRNKAHLMAKGHASYTVAETDALFDRKSAEKDQKGLGWPSCKAIQDAGCTACGTCKHLAAGKTPVHASAPAPTPAAPVVDDLPSGYTRDADGFIHKRSFGDDGSATLTAICKFPLKDPWLQKNPWILHFTTKTDRESQITIPFEIIGTSDMRRALQRQGFTIQNYDFKHVSEFIVSWTERLQKVKHLVISSAPFGWNIVNGNVEGFCYGGEVWTPKGNRHAANPDPVIATQYEPVGDASHWVTAAKMITDQERPALDAILASAFAAPLVRFTGQSGLLMSVYSMESGIGKTTTLKIAQAVWGDPVRAMQGLNDTTLSVINKIGEIRSLPLYWDELKTEDDTRKFVNLAFQLSLGKERSRLTSSVNQRTPGTWQTMMVSASNESLLDFITSRTKMTTAGLYRVFEYEVPPGTQGQIDPTTAQRHIAKLHDNYGVVGLEYAKYLGKNFAMIDAEIGKHIKELAFETNSTPDERFWLAIVSCVLMGAKYANQLGFTQINEERLKVFMLDILDRMRNERQMQPVDMKQAVNVSGIFAQFINATRHRHMLFTNRIHIGRGKPPKGLIKVVKPSNNLDGVYVQVGVEDKVIRISSVYMSDWLDEKGYSRHMFTNALKDQFGMRTIRGVIAGGTEWANPVEYLLEIDLSNTPLIDFIQD